MNKWIAKTCIYIVSLAVSSKVLEIDIYDKAYWITATILLTGIWLIVDNSWKN